MHVEEVVDGTGKMDAVTNEPSCFQIFGCLLVMDGADTRIKVEVTGLRVRESIPEWCAILNKTTNSLYNLGILLLSLAI